MQCCSSGNKRSQKLASYASNQNTAASIPQQQDDVVSFEHRVQALETQLQVLQAAAFGTESREAVINADVTVQGSGTDLYEEHQLRGRLIVRYLNAIERLSSQQQRSAEALSDSEPVSFSLQLENANIIAPGKINDEAFPASIASATTKAIETDERWLTQAEQIEAKQPTSSSTPTQATTQMKAQSAVSIAINIGDNSVPLTGVPGLDIALACKQQMFLDWRAAIEADPLLSCHSIHFQSLDMFGKKVGFLKFHADVRIGKKKSPGVVFMRGGAVAVLIILDCEGTEYTILTRQPRVPVGTSNFPELPAGMLDEQLYLKGVAVDEIKEECDIELKESDLIPLTTLAFGSSTGWRGVIPSAGGCDEWIHLFVHRKRVKREYINRLQGKLTGKLDEGEMIKLDLVPTKDIWMISPDCKVHSAMYLYNELKAAKLLHIRADGKVCHARSKSQSVMDVRHNDPGASAGLTVADVTSLVQRESCVQAETGAAGTATISATTGGLAKNGHPAGPKEGPILKVESDDSDHDGSDPDVVKNIHRDEKQLGSTSSIRSTWRHKTAGPATKKSSSMLAAVADNMHPLSQNIQISTSLGPGLAPIPVTAEPGCDCQLVNKVLACGKFQQWARSVAVDRSMRVDSIHIQSVDMFGRNVGFVKFQTKTTVNGAEVPGTVFMRGDAVGVLVILECAGKEYTILTLQPRVPQGCSAVPEIPAGMVDEQTGQFRGVAAQEMREETGLLINIQDLVDLTELAYGERFRGILPSAGGCDETVRLFLYRQSVSVSFLKMMDGRLTGNTGEGEQIILRLMGLDEAWNVSPDAKLLSALCLYDRLKSQGKIPELPTKAELKLEFNTRAASPPGAPSRRLNRTKGLVYSTAAAEVEETAKQLKQKVRQGVDDHLLLYGAEQAEEDELRMGTPVAAPVFVFTDIQGSTALMEANKQAMRQAVVLHNDCLRKLLPMYHATEVATEGDAFYLVFHSVADAILFCLEAQNQLLHVEWPDALHDLDDAMPVNPYIAGYSVVLFRGLRVRMGIHSTSEAVEMIRDEHSKLKFSYPPAEVKLAEAISECAAGGQVVVTGDAWDQFQESLDEDDVRPDVTHLGCWRPHGQVHNMTLYQLLPEQLKARGTYFAQPSKATLIERGFPNAPGQDGRVAIVYMKFCDDDLPFWDRAETSAALEQYQNLVRDSLSVNPAGSGRPDFGGYQFQQSRGGGRILVSFSNALQAAHFCCHIQVQLLSIPWSAKLLEQGCCTEVRSEDGSSILYRGLNFKMGIAYTDDLKQLDKMPTTGHADYIGPEANLAARLASHSARGQVAVSADALTNMFLAGTAPGSCWTVIAVDGTEERVVKKPPLVSDDQQYKFTYTQPGGEADVNSVGRATLDVRVLGDYQFKGTDVVKVGSVCAGALPREFTALGKRQRWRPQHAGRERAKTLDSALLA